MTDYNDGKWHEWNGGECPVHPKTTVEAVWHDQRMNTAGLTPERTAREDEGPRLAWSNVVKFRVVKEYREPREAWAVGDHLRSTEDAAWKFINDLIATNPNCGFEKWTPRRMREVLE